MQASSRALKKLFWYPVTATLAIWFLIGNAGEDVLDLHLNDTYLLLPLWKSLLAVVFLIIFWIFFAKGSLQKWRKSNHVRVVFSTGILLTCALVSFVFALSKSQNINNPEGNASVETLLKYAAFCLIALIWIAMSIAFVKGKRAAQKAVTSPRRNDSRNI